MATRKNFKKTGKPRRGGAKTGRIEKAKRMYSRNNPLLQSKASEFPSSEKFFSSYTPEYEKLYIETPAFRKNITTYVLDLPKKQFKEKLWFLMEKDIIDVKTMNDLYLEHRKNHKDEWPQKPSHETQSKL